MSIIFLSWCLMRWTMIFTEHSPSCHADFMHTTWWRALGFWGWFGVILAPDHDHLRALHFSHWWLHNIYNVDFEELLPRVLCPFPWALCPCIGCCDPCIKHCERCLGVVICASMNAQLLRSYFGLSIVYFDESMCVIGVVCYTLVHWSLMVLKNLTIPNT